MSASNETLRRCLLLAGVVLLIWYGWSVWFSRSADPTMIPGLVQTAADSHGFLICPEPGSGLQTSVQISVAIAADAMISDQRNGQHIVVDWRAIQPGQQITFRRHNVIGWASLMEADAITILADGDLKTMRRCITPSLAP